MPTDDANALLQVISQRYQEGSIILTTNRGGAKYAERRDLRQSPCS